MNTVLYSVNMMGIVGGGILLVVIRRLNDD
jgi:hypothetical protein